MSKKQLYIVSEHKFGINQARAIAPEIILTYQVPIKFPKMRSKSTLGSLIIKSIKTKLIPQQIKKSINFSASNLTN